LIDGLSKSHKDQEAIRETQWEKLSADIEAQVKTIAKLEATIQGQTEELGEIKTQLRLEKPGRRHTAMPYTERFPQQVVSLLLLEHKPRNAARECGVTFFSTILSTHQPLQYGICR
jgi:hypothetical protein